MAVQDTKPAPGILNGILERFAGWGNDRIASTRFQSWASRFFLTRPFVRRDAARLYDLVAGFVYTQVLLSCIELRILHHARNRAQDAEHLAAIAGIAPGRMRTLCQSAAALGLLVRQADGRYRLGRLGAAMLGVPGLEDMIRHNRLLYEDLSDPVALLRGKEDTALASYWPYVRGGSSDAIAAETAAEYSALMASSQALVAEETLRAISFDGDTHLVDVGGGTGTFLREVARAAPTLRLTLFDLPEVADAAAHLPENRALKNRLTIRPGSFLEDPLPNDGDAISLVRVLYDHDDAVVAELLQKVFDALPAGGRLILSEPMSGGARPSRSGDAYFGFYTMAMTTGQPRSPERHRVLLERAGFDRIQLHSADRPFVARIMSAHRPVQV
ncbi:MAG: methyltransferase [Pseudomonadota bacterium]